MSTHATSWQTRRGAEQPRRQRRAQQRDDVAGVGQLGQHRRADGQQRDEPRREARLRGDAARVGLHARGLLEPAGDRAQQAGEVAAGVALEQDRGDDRVPRGRTRAGAQALEHVLGARAERQRAGRRAQLGAGGARARRPRPPPPARRAPRGRRRARRPVPGPRRAPRARARPASARAARGRAGRRRAGRPRRRPRPRRDRPPASRRPAAHRRRRAPAAGARAASARGPRAARRPAARASAR